MARHDLGAMFSRITQQLIAAERPILDSHGLSMWAYVVLSQLDRQPADTQLALAKAIGYDKTRLVGLLDELEDRRLLTRDPDAADRRGRIVALTPLGSSKLAAARADIRKMETGVLRHLDPMERRTLLAVLPKLMGDGRG